MQIWNYEPMTGEMLGTSVADPDPMTPDAWIVPAHATSIAPGVTQPGRAWRFNSYRVWENVADCRGETWWKADAKDNTEPVVVDFIGDPSHQGLTNITPLAPPPPPVVATALQLFTALAANLGKTPAEIAALVEVAKTL